MSENEMKLVFDEVNLWLMNKDLLQKHLEEDRFLVYLQPKFSIETSELIGAEALVRYKDSSGMIIPPDRFIPQLEKSSLIEYVDFYIFEHICSKVQIWIKEGKTIVPISVNFSRRTLTESNCSQRINEIWNKYSIPHGYIEIEVTESITSQNDNFGDIIQDIRNSGFLVSMDDFGVGYANLALFTNTRFDVLKVDKSLIQDLQFNLTAQIVVQSIANICQKIKIQVIVEGVETKEQLALLKEFKCGGAQGFLFSYPLPLEEYERKYMGI